MKRSSVKILPYLAVFYTVALVVVMLIEVDDLPAPSISIGDKLVHGIAYFILTIVWFLPLFFNTKNFRFFRLLALVGVFTVIYGILIEVFQYAFTTYRSFDLYDMLANTIGVIIASFLIRMSRKGIIRFKNNLVLDKK